MAQRTDSTWGNVPDAVWDLDDVHGLLLQVGALAAFVAVWWVVALASPARILPEPPAVARVLASDVASGQLFLLVGQSLRHYVPGLLVGSGLGIAAGVAVGWSRTAELTLGTVAQVLRPVPPLAWIPFAIIWFGLDHASAAFLVSIVAFWISYYNAEGGVHGIDPELLEVARSLGTNSGQGLIRRVVLPGALPDLFTGFRTAAGQAWMVVVAAELIGAPGIGRHLWEASNFLSTDVVVAYMLVIGVLFLLTDRLVLLVQRRALRWR
ncbi:ABC transporter permease [Halorarum salinum]|uniref:ABC transporter permease n=1 Tax=Halorarum salinum TaxID=2743089 RepID=A0A7D5QA59_9EURY|nr:ABC transporter permease [Halobaculum salinum]QLG62376.1 ABC transporter permease [Halobaculum salinum]